MIDNKPKLTRDDVIRKLSSGVKDFSYMDLSGLDLSYLDFIDVNMHGADLSGSDLRGSVLMASDLRASILRGADLRDADLRGADLRDADLRGAILCNADLRDAIMHNADLRGADLRGAILRDADLSDTDLRSAIMDDETDINYACWPLWYGGLDVKIAKRQACQLAYHFCNQDCDDPEYIEARNAILNFANQFCCTDEYGILDPSQGCKKL